MTVVDLVSAHTKFLNENFLKQRVFFTEKIDTILRCCGSTRDIWSTYLCLHHGSDRNRFASGKKKYGTNDKEKYLLLSCDTDSCKSGRK